MNLPAVTCQTCREMHGSPSPQECSGCQVVTAKRGDLAELVETWKTIAEQERARADSVEADKNELAMVKNADDAENEWLRTQRNWLARQLVDHHLLPGIVQASDLAGGAEAVWIAAAKCQTEDD